MTTTYNFNDCMYRVRRARRHYHNRRKDMWDAARKGDESYMLQCARGMLYWLEAFDYWLGEARAEKVLAS